MDVDLLQLFDEMEDTLSKISQGFDYEEMLVDAEILLQDASIAYELISSRDGDSLLKAITDVYSWVEGKFTSSQSRSRRGRPQLHIDESQLSLLLSFQFSCVDIANMLQVSPRTIRRRIIQYDLEESASFSGISDTELNRVAAEFVHAYPNGGQRTFEGYLRGRGIIIQRRRIRYALECVDPHGVRQRLRRALHRRRYCVQMPNSLWHIDGHHKLIRWRMVIHGGIDGFSRLPVYLNISSNNLSETVLNCFVKAVSSFGVPSRVRCDKGGESTCLDIHCEDLTGEVVSLEEVSTTRGLNGSGEMFMLGVSLSSITCFMD